MVRSCISSVVVLIYHVVVWLGTLRVWLLQESIIPQLVLKRLDLLVDARQRDPSKVSKVFTNGHIQRVRPIEHVWVRLKVSSQR